MSKVTSKDGTAIAYEQLGKGPAVILVGGVLGDRSQQAPLAALLAPHFTVFNYDRRGHGESGDTPPYAVEREIEDLEALIKEAGGSAFVYGTSGCAILALEAAARGLAAKMKKLALWEPPYIVDDSRPPAPKEYKAQLTKLLSAGRRGDMVELFMTQAVGMPAEMVAQMRNAPWWSAQEALAHTLIYDATIVGGLLVADQAGGLRHSTHARNRRWGNPLAEPRGASGRRGPPQCTASHAERSAPQRSPRSHRSRIGGVLR